MRFCFLTTHLNKGGITEYLFTLAKGLKARSHDVFLVSAGGSQEQAFKQVGVELLTLDIKTKSELDFRIYKALAPLKRFVLENGIDVIHAQTRVTQVMAALLSKITGVPFVSTCHGFFKPRLSRKLFPCWGVRTIAVSPVVSKHLVKDFGVREDKVACIKNGIDLQDFREPSAQLREEKKRLLGYGAGPVIGMIARLSDVKGQDVLIKAMKHFVGDFPGLKVILIGEGKLKPFLERLIDAYNLREHIVFLPDVENKIDYLYCFDVFVMPSRMEGLGISVMEAQAAGLPVVASRVGGIPGLVEDNQTGLLVAKEDEEALAKALVFFLTHPEEARQMGEAARKKAWEQYDFSLMTDKTLDVYKESIEE